MTQTITEEEFPVYVKTISEQQWRELFNLIPEIEKTESFVQLEGLKLTKDGEFLFPYYVHAEVVDKFIKIVFELNLVISFDWPHWEEGNEILNDKSADFTEYDLTKLCKLLTIIMHTDRCDEGYLVIKFNDGTVMRVLEGVRGRVE